MGLRKSQRLARARARDGKGTKEEWEYSDGSDETDEQGGKGGKRTGRGDGGLEGMCRGRYRGRYSNGSNARGTVGVQTNSEVAVGWIGVGLDGAIPCNTRQRTAGDDVVRREEGRQFRLFFSLFQLFVRARRKRKMARREKGRPRSKACQDHIITMSQPNPHLDPTGNPSICTRRDTLRLTCVCSSTKT